MLKFTGLINCNRNLDTMDLKSSHTAPVLTDPAPISKSRLGVHPNLLPYPTGAFSDLILNIPRKKTGILDDVRACSWLDAMKASSPPHRKMMKDSNNELAPIDSAAYRAWMVIISPFNCT